jgi:hypothetical protein
MRIAVAGTHRNAKTTLVEAAGNVLVGFTVEPEPYEQLLDSGEAFLDDRDPESFLLQLEHLVARLAETGPGDSLLFDRSPLDFAAYIMASDERQLGVGARRIERNVLELVSEGLAHLELIAFLPLRPRSEQSSQESFRRLADRHLCGIVRSDSLGVLHANHPAVIELTGSTSRRLAHLMAAVDHGQ